MSKILISGIALVTAIAGLKTYIVVLLTMPDNPTRWVIVSGLFALFFVFTALVAAVSFVLLRKQLLQRRKEKLAPGAGEPVAKETIILRNAPEWGLSQAEADVAIFVAKGFSNAEIADMRGCAVATVKSQLGKIYHKSGLESRYQLIGFVTDEVCMMAERQSNPKVRLKTRNVLPLAGQSKSAA